MFIIPVVKWHEKYLIYIFDLFNDLLLYFSQSWWFLPPVMAENEECGRSRRPYNSQYRVMVLRFLDYLRTVRVHTTMNETELQTRIAEVAGVSVSSVQRFKRELKEGRLDSPPPKKRRTSPIMNSIDNFDETCIRRIMSSFYERGEIPTHTAILEKGKVSFQGSRTSLHKSIKKEGLLLQKREQWAEHPYRKGWYCGGTMQILEKNQRKQS